jgi:hypothetical protein
MCQRPRRPFTHDNVNATDFAADLSTLIIQHCRQPFALLSIVVRRHGDVRNERDAPCPKTLLTVCTRSRTNENA